MAVDKEWCLQQAIEITKSFGEGGSAISPAATLEGLYLTLVKLEGDIKE